MAVNQFTHRQVACKVVSLTELRKQYATNTSSYWRRPQTSSIVSNKLELKTAHLWVKEMQRMAEVSERLKMIDREVQILESLDHVRHVSQPMEFRKIG